jgi:hypothetical protein
MWRLGMNESTHRDGTATKLTEKLSEPLESVRRRSAGILAVAAAGLLSAVGYGLVAAIAALANDLSMFPPGEAPTGFAARAAAVLQFSLAGPSLVLLAVMLLAGSLLLTERVPWAAETASGQSQAGRASPLRLVLFGLSAAAGLIALLYAAAAGLALTAALRSPDPPPSNAAAWSSTSP